jgi:hypothetical protein
VIGTTGAARRNNISQTCQARGTKCRFVRFRRYSKGGDMASELGGPMVKMRAADLVFAAVFFVAATVVLVAALLLA